MLRKKFGFGISLNPPPLPDGNFGVFKTQNASTSVYNYNVDTTVSGLSLSTSRNVQISIGNSVAGRFLSGGASTTDSARYDYASNTIADVMGLAGMSTGSGATSLSNSMFGVVATNAAGIQPMRKYLFASETLVVSTSATMAQSSGAGAGDAEYGIMAMGGTTNVTNKFVYSNDVVTAGPTLTGNLRGGGVAGNTEKAYFLLGSTTATSASSVYSYTSELFTVGTSASSFLANYFLSATGNSVKGVYSLRSSGLAGATAAVTRTLKCDYSTGVFALGTALSTVNEGGQNGAVTNGNSGII